MTDKTRDLIYVAPLEQIVDFRFNDEVAGVFPDMIQRSVPGYGTLVAICGLLAGDYAQAGSICYDLGCSVGAVTLAMAGRIRQPDCRIVAVDNSQAMLARCRYNLQAQSLAVPVDLVCSDIRDIGIANASVVVLNFTLQFIPPDRRDAVIATVFDGMNAGGILILSEKVIFDDSPDNECMSGLHRAFKRANGYSELEISQKRSALEKVLIPETQAVHLARLHRAGFRNNRVIFQAFNFMSFMAVK